MTPGATLCSARGGPETAQRVLLDDIGPELTGDRRSGASAGQGHVRDQTLHATGQVAPTTAGRQPPDRKLKPWQRLTR